MHCFSVEGVGPSRFPSPGPNLVGDRCTSVVGREGDTGAFAALRLWDCSFWSGGWIRDRRPFGDAFWTLPDSRGFDRLL